MSESESESSSSVFLSRGLDWARFMLCDAMFRGKEGSRNLGSDLARLCRGGAGASSSDGAPSASGGAGLEDASDSEIRQFTNKYYIRIWL